MAASKKKKEKRKMGVLDWDLFEIRITKRMINEDKVNKLIRVIKLRFGETRGEYPKISPKTINTFF